MKFLPHFGIGRLESEYEYILDRAGPAPDALVKLVIVDEFGEFGAEHQVDADSVFGFGLFFVVHALIIYTFSAQCKYFAYFVHLGVDYTVYTWYIWCMSKRQTIQEKIDAVISAAESEVTGGNMQAPDTIYFTHNEELPRDDDNRHIAVCYFGGGVNAGVIRATTSIELGRKLSDAYGVNLADDYDMGEPSGSGWVCRYVALRH